MADHAAEVPMSPYGGRRFVLTIGAAIVYTGLLIAGIVNEESYIWLQGITVGAYMTASSIQKVAESK
jgi:hypothetical protein